MKCKSCGRKAESELCFWCKSKKPLKKFVKHEYNKEHNINKIYEVFLNIWKKRPHKSEIDEAFLGDTPLSLFFHHILPKEKYSKASEDEENIILLTGDQHLNVENDMYKYEEINRRRELLKIKYIK